MRPWLMRQAFPLGFGALAISVPADNHPAEPHVHIDHQYLAVTPDGEPVTAPAHPLGWHGEDDLAAMPVP